MTKNNSGQKLILLLFLTSCSLTSAGLLGAGTGEGSCAAPPFRSHEVQWSYGCPAFAPCCSEFGYCRPLSEWEYGANASTPHTKIGLSCGPLACPCSPSKRFPGSPKSCEKQHIVYVSVNTSHQQCPLKKENSSIVQI